MFSQEEILEDFVECEHRGKRNDLLDNNNDNGPLHGDNLHLAGFGCGDTKTDGDRFLAASEEEREKMRQMPRVVPKEEVVQYSSWKIDRSFKPIVRSHKEKYGRALSEKDAENIRRAVRSGRVSGREAARQYGVSHITVQRVMKFETFKEHKCPKE